MPYSPIKIANAILEIARRANYQLTPLQLIKLVYIAHGWVLAVYDRPLLNEPAQAWTYGPVVPSLYQAVKSYRASSIDKPLPGDVDPQPLDPEISEFLGAVFDRYKGISGTQLSALTHKSGTPWSAVWNERGQNAVIPDEIIKRHYVERLDGSA